MGEGIHSAQPVRLSVVLDEALSEHVRKRAFQERKSRSAYVRSLVAADSRRKTDASSTLEDEGGRT
jgi:Arc/MetJ-type ribon-helix-helix transcriptional regulator